MVSFQPAPHPRILEFSSLITVNSELRSSSTKRRGWSRFRTRGQAASCKDLPVWTGQSLLLPSPPTHNASVTPGGEAEIPGRSSDIVGGGDGTVGTRKLCPVLSTRSAEPHRAGKTVHGRRGCRSALEGELKPSWNKGGGRARSTLVSTPMPGTLPLL